MSKRPGASFEDSEVVDLYPYRPPYPESVFEKLLKLAPRPGAVLDLGCGPGKVSRPLTRSFKTVVAVDPSRNMIALGQNLPDGRAPNLVWINSLAEDARQMGAGSDRRAVRQGAAGCHLGQFFRPPGCRRQPVFYGAHTPERGRFHQVPAFAGHLGL